MDEIRTRWPYNSRFINCTPAIRSPGLPSVSSSALSSPLSPPVPSTHATSSLSFVSSLGYGMPFTSTSVPLFFFSPSSRRSYQASTPTAYATFFFSSFVLVRARTSVLGLPLERRRMATQHRDISRNRTTTIETRVGKLRAKKEFHSYLPSFISGYGTM